MKPSVTNRWIVVGTAAALGVGAVSASAVALNDRAPADRTAAAVTLSQSPAGDVPNGTAVADTSPESADSPNESAVDTVDSADTVDTVDSAESADSPAPAQQRAFEVTDSPTSPDSAASADSGTSADSAD
ncbi:hypothetical protein [Isoptericola variabilis]|uniref:Uncharacterized protein n=1 Tax=Isoptericola variabilis (strain 225) TaxID=743718 RepID=F6FV77_ISOV2|nr:hypothetical protein [Isoptericola variabilis]AEG45505.1 hypothetical protein Isova_2816 [Isoptericola variabilis 225]TWH33807.1 hypothetical protein L600_001500000180 [Isoptericola variabilis J7]